jgi:hypothetical protein
MTKRNNSIHHFFVATPAVWRVLHFNDFLSYSNPRHFQNRIERMGLFS